MDLRLATLKAISFYLLRNAESYPVAQLCVNTLLGYPNYRWDLIW
jgi:hypothetical protein